MTRQIRILFTNTWLLDRAGTELVVCELAAGARAAGHYPMVYSPRLGRVAEDLRIAGIPVTDNLNDLPQSPDIIHGQHHVETIQALLRFPQACAIYVCHDRTNWRDTPPVFNRILRYVAAGLSCRIRILNTGLVPEEKIEVIQNWVQTDRFACRSSLPAKPKRALVYSNYAESGGYIESVRKACDAAGIALDVIGRFYGNTIDKPEEVLGKYDIVFAVGRSALEAMASGSAVILCGIQGLGPMVTSEEVETLRQWNFGMTRLTLPLESGSILKQILRYDPDDARKVSSHIRLNSDFPPALAQYLKLYEKVLDEHESRRTTNGDEVGDYLRATVQRLGEYELKICGLGTPPQWMEALDESEGSNIRLKLIDAPLRVKPGEEFYSRVKLINNTNWTLHSSNPFPVHLAYHWVSPFGKVILFEGIRTLLPAPLSPGDSTTCRLKVIAPQKKGLYRLLPTLVQENVRWMDRVCSGIFPGRLIRIK